jgi:hypothetical protein
MNLKKCIQKNDPKKYWITDTITGVAGFRKTTGY